MLEDVGIERFRAARGIAIAALGEQMLAGGDHGLDTGESAGFEDGVAGIAGNEPAPRCLPDEGARTTAAAADVTHRVGEDPPRPQQMIKRRDR